MRAFRLPAASTQAKSRPCSTREAEEGRPANICRLSPLAKSPPSSKDKGGLLVRVDPASYATALREPHVQPMKMGKRVMSGFVRVAPEGYRTTEELRVWVLRGVAGVASRKASAHPRPRRKRRAGRPA